MQAKDIPEEPILEFLRTLKDARATYGKGFSMPTVQDAMPTNTPLKVQLAKMRALIKRGLVLGCACGCRGDFWIAKGD
jgi:hypothetical protein